MFGGSCGIDDPKDADVPPNGRFRNFVCEGHVEWRPPGPLVFGFEFRRLLLLRRARMLFAPAIPLLGTVHLMRRSPEPLFHRRIWVRHSHDDFLLLTLPAHAPRRCLICRAWWRAWMRWKRIHSSTVRSPMRGCFTNKSARRSGNRARST